MEAFFKDLVCHGEHALNDSFDQSGSEGDSPRGAFPRSSTNVMARPKNLQGHKSNSRSLKKDWGSADAGQIPVWEDIEPSTNDGQDMEPIQLAPKLEPDVRGVLEDFDFAPKPPGALEDFDFAPKPPAINRIPKHKRLSFPDENEGINTVRANYDPETDRCKAMDMATKQAGLREIAARAMLGEKPPKHSPALGELPTKSPTSSRLPTPPKKGKLGFGSSSRRLDSLPPPPLPSSRGPSPLRSSRRECPAPLPSSRDLTRSDTPEPQRPSGRHDGAESTSPMQKQNSKGMLLPKPPGAPPTPRNNRPPDLPNWGPPASPQQGAPPTPQRQKSPSFVLNGPPRCPSMTALSPQGGRQASQSRTAGEKRRNSYVSRQDSFSLSGNNDAMGSYTYRGPEPQRMQSSQNLNGFNSARFPPMQNNSYAPPPSPMNSYVAPPTQANGNSWVPPPIPWEPPAILGSHSNSYNPPQAGTHAPLPTSPMAQGMVMSGSRPNLSPEPVAQYPNSMEKVRNAGLAIYASLFAPPPRMLSYEGFGAAAPPSPGPPRRMMSCERTSPAPQPPSMPSFPLPSVPPPLPTFSFEAMLSPLRQRLNSYEPPLIRH